MPTGSNLGQLHQTRLRYGVGHGQEAETTRSSSYQGCLRRGEEGADPALLMTLLNSSHQGRKTGVEEGRAGVVWASLSLPSVVTGATQHPSTTVSSSSSLCFESH